MRRVLYFIIVAIFILISFITLHSAYALNESFPLIGKTIVIDPGHGGADAGASISNVQEKKVNLDISKALKHKLEIYGATVLLTRNEDYDLSEPKALYRKKSDFDNRIAYINNSKADLYLSIHLNTYGSTKYRGPQVFFSSKNALNESLAKQIQADLNIFTKSNRKIKIISDTYMYDKLNINGVLIECGFLSNDTDRFNLTNEKYQNDFTIVIVKSLIKYFV